jgi:hypothetical protein
MGSRWNEFRPCPQCGYDFGTDEGEMACSWVQCPYMPEELDVFCDRCRFNFYTMEGNPSCADPMTCDLSIEPIAHAANMREWRRARGLATG